MSIYSSVIILNILCYMYQIEISMRVCGGGGGGGCAAPLSPHTHSVKVDDFGNLKTFLFLCHKLLLTNLLVWEGASLLYTSGPCIQLAFTVLHRM